MTPEQLSFHVKFAFDNIRDGIKDGSLIMWPAWDTREVREVFVIGRRVEDKVLPVAVLIEDSLKAVKRYAPAKGPGDYDFSQVESKIIRP